MLLDSFDSVEDVDLSNQEKATPKAKALPEMTDGEPADTGKECETLTLLQLLQNSLWVTGFISRKIDEITIWTLETFSFIARSVNTGECCGWGLASYGAHPQNSPCVGEMGRGSPSASWSSLLRNRLGRTLKFWTSFLTACNNSVIMPFQTLKQ